MKAQLVSLTNRGQMTIPSYIREKLNLSTGSKLELIVQDNSFMVIPINKSVKNLKHICLGYYTLNKLITCSFSLSKTL
ncbi:AbrB/MazE/SpoVT family DNA-binding domain-containing protein [Rickettsia asembonensis]|uniref:AbrB/MazE/SpoVT family DNA-binding domain-containing protein n=1 Tax=Rickettsia asembonensis TaxID=1068590 RepID=UPI0009D70BB5|nr:AbrB/MazE/SpoVT family DNA-binding domain-containing protein [Rickettsia asembonensis]WCR56946.1 MAG: hypothetical protein PG979_001003 [Rickettsia asembonensis]